MKKLLPTLIIIMRNIFVTALVIGAMIGFFWLLSLSAPYSYIPFIVLFGVFIVWVYTIVADVLG